MYDIVLFIGCLTLPAFDDLQLDAKIKRNLSKSLCPHPGFLELDIPENGLAVAILQRLKTKGAHGLVIPAVYRVPQITKEMAFPIAQRFIKRLQTTDYPNVRFEEVKFLREHPLFWTFGSVSNDLLEEGIVPGALFASIDKLDGHIWKGDEGERFMRDINQLKY